MACDQYWYWPLVLSSSSQIFWVHIVCLVLFISMLLYFSVCQAFASRWNGSVYALVLYFISGVTCVSACLQQNSYLSNPRCISLHVEWFDLYIKFPTCIFFYDWFYFAKWFLVCCSPGSLTLSSKSLNILSIL